MLDKNIDFICFLKITWKTFYKVRVQNWAIIL